MADAGEGRDYAQGAGLVSWGTAAAVGTGASAHAIVLAVVAAFVG